MSKGKLLLCCVAVALVGLAFSGAAQASPAAGEALVSCYGYGDGLAGNPMANGQAFDPDSDSIAHKWLPFGTPVLFRFGGREVVGIVRDRGPYHGAREYDLGCGLMARLGLPPGVYVVGVD